MNPHLHKILQIVTWIKCHLQRETTHCKCNWSEKSIVTTEVLLIIYDRFIHKIKKSSFLLTFEVQDTATRISKQIPPTPRPPYFPLSNLLFYMSNWKNNVLCIWSSFKIDWLFPITQKKHIGSCINYVLCKTLSMHFLYLWSFGIGFM